MHASMQPDGRSTKPVSGPMLTSQLKSGSDNVQNTGTSFPSQVKGKKRERGEQGFEPIKRERSSKMDADFVPFTAEKSLKCEIVKITDRGGLVDIEGVEKLVQLMLHEKSDRTIDLGCRSLLAGVIAASDNFDCLSQFVQLRGLPVLYEWLQDVHKGKIGDGNSPKDNDKSVEEFLLVLLRALDKLPVNLNALQMCNIGKSVNLLRSNKNFEIQKKARSLVDKWKKRVEAEWNSHDAKSGSSQPIPWSARARHTEVSHGGNRQVGGSSEAALKSSLTLVSASRSASVKPVQAETVKSACGSVRPTKSVASSASGGNNSKDAQPRPAGGCGTPDHPQTAGREEKSSSSSQSHNNSQSCSSDHAKTLVFQGKEDARSSTAGSMNVNKLTSGRHRKSVNGYQGTSGSSRSSLHRNTASEKMSQSGLTCEKRSEIPGAEGSIQKLLVKIPNRGRSPAQSVGGGAFEDPSVMNSQASSPVTSEKHNPFDHNFEKNDSFRANITSDVKTESWQSNDFKDILTGSDEGDGSPAAVPDEERCRIGDDDRKIAELPKAASSSSGNEPKSGKLNEVSFSSMNALIESCVNYSEANASVSVADDVGMNLLASVAAGEISKPDLILPSDSSVRNIPLVVDSCTANDVKPKPSGTDDLAQGETQPNYGSDDDIKKHSVSAGSSWRKDGLCNLPKHTSTNPSGDGKTDCLSVERSVLSCLETKHGSDVVASVSASGVVSATCSTEKAADGDKGQQHHRTKAVFTGADAVRTPDSKFIVSCPEEKVNNLSVEGEKKVVEVEKNVSDGLNSVVRREQKPPTAIRNSESPEKTNEEVALHPISGNLSSVRLAEDDAKLADEVGSRSHVSQAEKQKIGQENNGSPTRENSVVGCLGSTVADSKRERVEENMDNKEVYEHQPGGSASQAECVKRVELNSTRTEVEETEECASSTADASSFSVAGGSEMDTKLEFDLNEGFNVDDGKYAEPINLLSLGCSTPANLVSPLPFPVSSVSSGLPASITVAAAAKGPFVPHEHLLRSKGEIGWKGSAATSAFRPAEPRKVLEMPLGTAGAPLSDTATVKHGRPPLDIDLNVPDERIFEDMACRNFAEDPGSIVGTSKFHDLSCTSAPVRSCGGLDFDLNRVDEATDIGQCSTSNGHRLQVPHLSVKSSSSGRYPNGEVSFRGNFDLNNGPGLDDTSVEPSPFGQHARSSMLTQAPVACVRMNNAEMGNYSSWFPPANTYSALTIPSILPDRGEKLFPLVATSGAPRILGSHIGGSPLGNRGPVLSSSPAGSFPSTPFQYPVFPFGTSFPLPSTSFSVSSTTYMDSPSGGRLCFPAIHTQLLGPAGSVSSQFPRPYIVSLSDGASNGGPDNSRKCGKQGLDLNAGPGGPDIEGREEMLPLASRPFLVAGSQSLAEEQGRMYQVAGGTLKRKDLEDGHDTERFSYKQSSWQ